MGSDMGSDIPQTRAHLEPILGPILGPIRDQFVTHLGRSWVSLDRPAGRLREAGRRLGASRLPMLKGGPLRASRPGFAWPGLACLGLSVPGLAWPGLAWLGLA